VVSSISTQLKSSSDHYQQVAHESARLTQWLVLSACLALAILTVAIFVTLSTSITKALARTNRVLNSMAEGDLSQRLPLTNNNNNEFNQLAMAINQTCENLGSLIQEVKGHSQALSDNAQQLNTGIEQVVTSQSDAVGQTQLLASATEEISATTHEVSNSLEFVAEVSKSSTLSATEGSKVITLAIESIEEVNQILTSATDHIQQLEDASKKIDSVMSVINGIAEQTNLLALNAAIEAARAGEQGRGFAVVADEVRNLAVRTVEAIAEISGTIGTMKQESLEVIQFIGRSEESMNIGRERGQDAVRALGEITEKTGEASHQTEVIVASIKELAATSQSMAESMGQISSAMSEIENNNQGLKDISQAVDKRSTTLDEQCTSFTLA
jgi:methyl-accepting chemotaxis protein